MTYKSNQRKSTAGSKARWFKSMNAVLSYCKLLLSPLRKAPKPLGLRTVQAKGAVQEKGGTCFHNGLEKLVLEKFRKSNDGFLILPQAYIVNHGYNYSPKHHCFLIIHFIAPGDCFLIKIH